MNFQRSLWKAELACIRGSRVHRATDEMEAMAVQNEMEAMAVQMAAVRAEAWNGTH